MIAVSPAPILENQGKYAIRSVTVDDALAHTESARSSKEF